MMTTRMVLFLWVLANATGLVSAAEQETLVAQGKYVFRASACESCHTDVENNGAFLAGGRAMETDFGTFYTPNITPDLDTGIGRWTLEDFRQAMMTGTRPDGSPYYPIFPYRWYTGMLPEDIAALWAYLQSIEPIKNNVPPHDLKFPFTFRWLNWIWRLINFKPGKRIFDEQRPAQWNRGAYLVNHLGHCGACHTPKTFGNFIGIEFLGGSRKIPGVLPAPNITPSQKAGIGIWSQQDIVRALKRAIGPDGTPIRGPMAEYVLFGSSYLTDEDLNAMAIYLRSLPIKEQTVETVEEEIQEMLGHGD
ncbi:c-type cytochrome [Nitrosococcus wardiae]|nr:cytochrome c [Nitrosococcus wardiae]